MAETAPRHGWIHSKQRQSCSVRPETKTRRRLGPGQGAGDNRSPRHAHNLNPVNESAGAGGRPHADLSFHAPTEG